MPPFVTRKNIRHLSIKERDDLVRAWDGIQKLKPDHKNSFFKIAGYHGEPFRGAGWGSPQWWGGYCNHGNVLFPTWHRAYLARLEAALQSIVPGVALAYWDETEEESLKQGIPKIFLQRDYVFEDGRGEKIRNPLYSYTFQARISDNLPRNPNDPYNYSKHPNYETVRYPFSGLVGTPEDQEKTKDHNEALNEKGDVYCNQLLNGNIVTWLNLPCFRNDLPESAPEDKKWVKAGIKDKFVACMNAPNYTVFSNTTSAQQWNQDHKDATGATTIVPLEAPHNSMHLAVGGFEVKTDDGSASYNIYPYANGDMGENDTASFDPIFYFHHAWIDLVFSLWQSKHGGADSLTLIDEYPGTNSVDSQGPTPGVAGGTWLKLDSHLAPFMKPGKEPGTEEPVTSYDVADISKLNYSYEYSGILKPVEDQPGKFHAPSPPRPSPVMSISNISRARIGGSFVVSAWATPKNGTGDTVLLGAEAVLSRHHVTGCANCQNHLQVNLHVPLRGFTKEKAEQHEYDVIVHTRDGRAPTRPGDNDHAGYGAEPGHQEPKFKLHFGHLE